MKLLIVSHTAHYRAGDTWLGWGPTVRELDHLAALFDEVVHVAPLHPGRPPGGAIPYRAANLRLRPVAPAGGPRFTDKLKILKQYPAYARVLWEEMRQADVVHVRCPANLSIVALALLTLRRHPEKRWLKYAGNWQPYEGEPWSYALQRWWLRTGRAGGVVTVNGAWPDQPAHVHSFLNPCLTEEELREGRSVAAEKQLGSPLRMLYVGRLERAKGVGRALKITGKLRQQGVAAVLDLVGDGPERAELEAQAEASGVRDGVTFHGWVPRGALDAFYARAHLLLFPSTCSEGWPKVLSEGMAYGVVPVAGRVSSIPQYLERFGTGGAYDPEDLDAFVRAAAWYASHPEVWKEQARQGVAAAASFGYPHYLEAVRRLLHLEAGSVPIPPEGAVVSEPVTREAVGARHAG